MPSASNFPPETESVAEAQIVFGNVPFDGTSLFDIDDDGLWEDYRIINRYEGDYHRYMLGIASPNGFQGNQVAFVQLAADTLLLVSDWTAKRRGQKPTIPEPEPVDDNFVLLDKHREPDMVNVGADENNPIWRISGTYVYGAKNPNQVNMYYPRAPWLTTSLDRQVDSDDFIDGLIDSGTAGGSLGS